MSLSVLRSVKVLVRPVRAYGVPLDELIGALQ